MHQAALVYADLQGQASFPLSVLLLHSHTLSTETFIQRAHAGMLWPILVGDKQTCAVDQQIRNKHASKAHHPFPWSESFLLHCLPLYWPVHAG